MLAAGGYWYVRNLVAVGNPIPYIGSVGPISLPAPVRDFQLRPDFAVVHYWHDTSVWRHWFFPGPPRVVRDAVAGDPGRGCSRWARSRSGAAASRSCGSSARVRARHRGRLRVHAADRGGRAGAADRLHLERPLPGAGGGAWGWRSCPACPPCARRRRAARRARRRWPWCWRSRSARSSSGSRVTSRARSPRPLRRPRARAAPARCAHAACWARLGVGAWVGAGGGRRAAVGLAAGYGEQRHYLAQAYEDTGAGQDLAGAIRWARDMRDARIAVAGIRGVFTQYPFYGADLSNRVQWLGVRGAARLLPADRRPAPNGARRSTPAASPTSSPPSTPTCRGRCGNSPGGPLDAVRPERPRGPARTGPCRVFQIAGPLDPAGCKGQKPLSRPSSTASRT